jgi:hypothetical protein
MPIKGSVGTSRFTPIKNKIFREILDAHLNIVWNIHQRHSSWVNPNYLFLDLNAGDGQPTTDGSLGSALSFIDIASQYKDMSCIGRFIEIDSNSCLMLEQSLSSRSMVFSGPLYQSWKKDNVEVDILNESNENFLRLPSSCIFGLNYFHSDKKKSFGLIYCDPNNGDTPIIELSKVLSYPEFKYLDVLINRNCTAAKRINGVRPNSRETLFEIVEILPKDFWFIREPETQHQFSLMLGTSSKKLPRFKNLGFHNIKSVKGKILMNSLSYPKTVYSIPVEPKKTKLLGVDKTDRKETPPGMCWKVLNSLDELPSIENLTDEFSISQNQVDELIDIVKKPKQLNICELIKKDIPPDKLCGKVLEDLDKLSIFENLIDEFSMSQNKTEMLSNMVINSLKQPVVHKQKLTDAEIYKEVKNADRSLTETVANLKITTDKVLQCREIRKYADLEIQKLVKNGEMSINDAYTKTMELSKTKTVGDEIAQLIHDTDLTDTEVFKCMSDVVFNVNPEKESYKISLIHKYWTKSQRTLRLILFYLRNHELGKLPKISNTRLAKIAGVGMGYISIAKIIAEKRPEDVDYVIDGKISLIKVYKTFLWAKKNGYIY